MTDDVELKKTATKSKCGAKEGTETNESGTHKSMEEKIVEFLSRNEKIFFKSQQIDDPDFTTDEKKQIARNIFNESHTKFLLRFGKYLQSQHLDFFHMNSYTDDEEYEIEYLVRNFRIELVNREKNVKNRRYAAIKTMMTEDGYFSEKEMMRREPHLYEQLVGQYLTDREKRVRDGPGSDPNDTPFSQILLENMEKERIEDLRKKQERDDTSETTSQNSCDSSEANDTANEDMFPKIPQSYRKQWGNFEDEDESTSAGKHKKEKTQKYITAGEREMLRQEFIGIMHTKFLEGMDKNFDYSKIDDNPDLDDLNQISQDNEDKYFDNDEDDEGFECREIRMEQDECLDDDLDIFMEHLEGRPLVQNDHEYYTQT